jgi:MFS family permease
MEGLATESANTGRIGRGIGLVTTDYAFGFAIGSFAGGVMTGFFGFPLTFSIYFAFAALSIPVVWFIDAPKHPDYPETLPQGGLSRRLFSRGLVAGNVLGASYTFGLATIMTLLSVYAEGFRIPIFWIGAAFSIFWGGRILGAALAGTASDTLGRRRVAMTALIVGCVGFVTIGSAPSLLLIVAGALLTGLSISGVFPVNVAIIADDVDPELRGTAMGFFEMVCAIAFMVASAFGGISAELVNSRTPYGLSAVVSASCVIALGVLLPRGRQSTSAR